MSIETLTKEISELIDWKNSVDKKQINFPLDRESKNIFQRNLIAVSDTQLKSPFLVTDLIGQGLIFQINSKKYAVKCSEKLKEFTVNTTLDLIENVSGAHMLTNGDRIYLVSTGTLPSEDGTPPVPLTEIDTYYVVGVDNTTPTTFQISHTSGGSAIDIVSSGSGSHYYFKVIPGFQLI